MMLLGGWMSASPLAQERFQRLGYQDGAECLYNSKEVSLIAEEGFDVAWLEAYEEPLAGVHTVSKEDFVKLEGSLHKGIEGSHDRVHLVEHLLRSE